MKKTASFSDLSKIELKWKGGQQQPHIQPTLHKKYSRLSKKASSLFLVALLAFSVSSLLKPTWASSGNILINAAEFPSSIIEVPIGGNISLYFGKVTWSGVQVILYLSKDGYASVSNQTDVRFGPTFNVVKIRDDVTDFTTYPNFIVGRNWVNGTIPKTLEVAGGDYFVKAFDGSSAAVAVTDRYFTITASFEVVPKYGPGQAYMELRGYALPSNDYVNLSYSDGNGWKTIANFYRADVNGRLTYFMSAPDLAEVLPSGLNSESYSTVTFKLIVNSTGQTLLGTFDEYRRGLKQVYSPDSKNLTTSEGQLYGNNTVFILFGFYVRVKGDLTIAGQWFNPGTIMILWDDMIPLGITKADKNGFFETQVTVPITSEGNHTIIVQDSTVKFVLNVICLSVLDEIPPVANAGPDKTVNEDATFIFDGSGSRDNKGIISYVWTFIDALPKSLHGVNPEYVFTNPGVYHVMLNVTDVAENWDTDDFVVTVLDITVPVAEAGPDQIINEDTSVTLNGFKSTDNKGIVLYVWTIIGDTVWTSTGKIVEHNFTEPGVYAVTLNVSDATGNWNTDALTITVLDVTNPVAEAGAGQTTIEGSVVRFNAGYSSDNVGIVAYEWNFGDGTNSSGLTANHTYSSPGNYTVFLIVIDQAGNKGTDSVIITALKDTDRDSVPDVTDDDDDGDGMPDTWEIKFGLNPLISADVILDNDGDGLTNLLEYLASTDPNDFFSPLQLWVIGVTMIPIFAVAVAVYFTVRITKVSKQEYVEKEVSKFANQIPDVKQLNPSYYNWKITMIRQEAEKQFDELNKTGYIIVTRTNVKERLVKALKKKLRKSSR